MLPDCIAVKVCSKCGYVKPATTEYFRARGKYLRPDCIECNAKRQKEYYKAHPEKKRDYNREWTRNNRDKVRAQVNRRKERYPHAETERQKKYYQENRERVLKRTSQYKKDNPEKHRVHCRNRRALERNAEGTHTEADELKQYEIQKGLCWWCLEPVGEIYHVDHRVPLKRGGTNWPSNLVISCPYCNDSRGRKLPHEWSDRLL